MKKYACLALLLSIVLLPSLAGLAYGSKQSFSGYGDDIVEIPSIEDGYAFYIEGNRGSRHFSVKAYDISGDYLELLVNTTEVYKGTTLDPSLTTRILEVNAEGSWKIQLVPLYSLESVTRGRTFMGEGDSVVLVKDPGMTASITGNAGEHHFSIWSYGETGRDLLVNTTDRYSGKVMLRNDPFLFVISAEGSWTILLN